jgi:tRNA(adenine34) deaminase
MNDKDLVFMQEALAEARLAALQGEVPVGCVIVRNDEVIARNHNRREETKHVFAHAEMLAIDEACKQLGWRLDDCTLYVTLEPCPMCAGAMIQARLKRLVYGAPEPKFGSDGSVVSLFEGKFNHQVDVESGVLSTEASQLLKSFFKTLRPQK